MDERSPQTETDVSPVTHTAAQDPCAPRPPAFAFLRPAEGPDELGRLGGFRLLKKLGEGGMGMVFLAEDVHLGRQVALKVMRPEIARHEESRHRFLREARAMATVEHEHVVPIHQVGEDAGVPFLVMAFLKGESLEDRLRRAPELSLDETVRIGSEAAEGLAAAHAAGLIHRDVKPSNLWLETTASGPRVKVLDFGLARQATGGDHLTRTAALMGTAGYMAPEQARGEPLDARADLFSLGCVLYRMLTGRPPFQGKTLSAVLLQVETLHPPAPRDLAPSLPAPLSDLVMRLLAKDRAGRPASARETAETLRSIEPSAVAASTTVTAAPPPKAPSRRGRYWGVAVVAGCGLLLIGLFLLSPLRTWLTPAAHETKKTADDGTVSDAPPAPAVPAAWKGSLELQIEQGGNGAHPFLRLNERDAPPLKPGEMVAVTAQLDHPGYCYVVWIEPDGKLDPVYPWHPGDWTDRPANERPVRRLRQPEESDSWHTLEPSASGTHTLLLLVRDTPLPPDVDLQMVLKGDKQSTAVSRFQWAVWFENGELVRDETGRGPNFEDNKLADALALQKRIRSQVGPGEGKLFQYTRAIAFSSKGK